MKILEAQSAILTNAEVLAHIQSTTATSTTQTSTNQTPLPNPSRTTTTAPAPTAAINIDPFRRGSKYRNVDTVLKELSTYLTATLPAPSSPTAAPPTATSPDTASIPPLLTALHKHYPSLTKPELLQLVNLRPTELGVLDCVVEECDVRFSVQEQEEILEILRGGGEGGG